MNRKLIISLSIIAAIAAVVIGGTTAFFSNTETSTGNTFIAGAIDLKIDNECHLNGRVCANGYWQGTTDPCSCTWELMDLDGKAIFNFTDVKPGDDGEDTISLHVDTNPAWVCAEISNVMQTENGCNSPELKVDGTCDTPGPGQGELWDNLTFSIWMDDNCDNILNGDETYLAENVKATDLKWPIADSQNGGQPIRDACIGVEWHVPDAVGNIIQGDSVTGDITFNAYQARNNGSFVCNPPVLTCGDGTVTPPETCELPGDINSTYCSQETSQCVDYKIQTRDGYGDCNGTCGCTDDPWGDPVCSVAICSAPCDSDDDCNDQNSNTSDTCNLTTCGCEHGNLTYCGDGTKQSPNQVGTGGPSNNGYEDCDGTDGVPAHYTCSGQCVLVYQPYCGDGIVEPNSEEQCDDGNNVNNDACNNSCVIQASLTVNKAMITDDGGNETAANFQLYVDGSPVNNGQTYWYTLGVHVVSESGVSGYDGKFLGTQDCDQDGNVTLNASDNKTCTLTNDDIRPNITLIKNVINDNGGSALPTDFKMRVNGVLVPTGGSRSVNSNTNVTITEDAFPGYTPTGISGTGCPASLGTTFQLNEGVAITCTITNDDNQP